MKFDKRPIQIPNNLMYGRNPSLSFLATNKVKKVYLQKGFSDKKILDEIAKRNVDLEYVEQIKLNELTNNGNHQGIACIIEEFQYSSVSEIILKARKEKNPVVLILDGIEDPHNLGAIIRSADAFNVTGIIIKEKNQVQVNMTVVKVSTGAANYVKIARVSNLNNAIKELKDNGFWIYAADGAGKEDYNNINFDGSVGLVLGSEGFGISNLLLKNSDVVFKIPMYGHVNSLNVSVATGILLSRIRNN